MWCFVQIFATFSLASQSNVLIDYPARYMEVLCLACVACDGLFSESLKKKIDKLMVQGEGQVGIFTRNRKHFSSSAVNQDLNSVEIC